tara:strand:+ start:67 stop:945 length:879 start_codon:yes stop_codon:yes gene_type:complete
MENWRYYTGPHLGAAIESIPPALHGLLTHFSPSADMNAMVSDAQSAGRNLRAGNTAQGLLDLGYAAAAPLGLLFPGTIKDVRRLTKEAYEQLPGGALFKPSKKRSKWPAERREQYADNLEYVTTLRQERDAARRASSDPLGPNPSTNWLTGGDRLKHKLEQQRAASSAATNLQRLDPGNLWNAARREDVKHWADAGMANAAVDYVNRANLEAVPRILKKEGWTLRHSSVDKSGRKSSRYLVAPDGTEVRLSNHYLPPTPARNQNPRWHGEIVLNGDEPVQEVLAAVRNFWEK